MATHVLPADELDLHTRRPDCSCDPFAEWVASAGRWRVVHKALIPSVPLFTAPDLEDVRLVQAPARTSREAWVASSDEAEAATDEAATDEDQVR